jgi:hypothetical protein
MVSSSVQGAHFERQGSSTASGIPDVNLSYNTQRATFGAGASEAKSKNTKRTQIRV